MSLVRRIARPLLAAPFIVDGVRTAVSPSRAIDVLPAAFKGADRALHTTAVPNAVGVKELLRVSGAVAAGAGLMYATGRNPRLAAGVLLVTTTVGWAGRRKIWELSGPERLEELAAIATDAGLLGGVLLAVVDHDGRPSLRYQVEQFLERAQKNAEAKKKQLEKSAGKTAKAVRSGAREDDPVRGIAAKLAESRA
ncbi:hypothetical protein [Brachybacterium hainanense]|uniref:DoxX family protein n=1 Tax=Brachybacterium hainanense TaxID=1541174 RepID=A0ABV6R8Y6_9MICO